ncbi:hypothetical protein MAMT_00625 [Methylacidimicrobium tartarophylax]|uniref:Uncharacterized protein n=1 Tax=Methylacidimicrobium tartarophylax TaxID=1041768 RepID=A0A5E6MAP1_9BACT|nr:hypothetical protein MAMT_00625 [Methylacidimicrobium tartarophylax]
MGWSGTPIRLSMNFDSASLTSRSRRENNEDARGWATVGELTAWTWPTA